MLFWGLHYAHSEPDCLVASRRHEHVTHEPQWNLDLTKFQATGGNVFVISRVHYIENLDLTNFWKNRQYVRYISRYS